MPKKIDKEKEQAFIEYFCEGDTAGNATANLRHIRYGYICSTRFIVKFRTGYC